jgi:hypothetical protein
MSATGWAASSDFQRVLDAVEHFAHLVDVRISRSSRPIVSVVRRLALGALGYILTGASNSICYCAHA